MQKKKREIDIVDKVLDACYKAGSKGIFIESLMHQYEERGSLSKKQLQGLYQKALQVKDMPVNWLATLEATILKMATRYKPSLTITKALNDTKDEHAGELIAAILAKYPQHKRVLFLQSKYENKETLTPAEITELEKFYKILLQKN
jgi:hypothetical protein